MMRSLIVYSGSINNENKMSFKKVFHSTWFSIFFFDIALYAESIRCKWMLSCAPALINSLLVVSDDNDGAFFIESPPGVPTVGCGIDCSGSLNRLIDTPLLFVASRFVLFGSSR